VWDLASAKPISKIDTNEGWITAMCFSPDQRRLALGRADSTVRLLDLANGSLIGVLRGHRHAIVHVDWQPDGTLHTISLDGMAKTWNAGSALEVPTITTSQPESIALAFDPSGANIIIGGGDGTVQRWTVGAGGSGQPVKGRDLAAHAEAVLEVAVHESSGTIATAGRDGVVRVAREIATNAPPLLISPGAGPISSLDFSPDGSQLIIGADRQVALWDAATGKLLHDYSTPGVVANEIIFDHSGDRFYSACADGFVRCRDVKTSRLVREAMIDPHGLYDVRQSPDGRTLVVAGDTQTVALLDAHTLEPIKRYAGHPGGVLAVAFHPGGQRVASGGTDGIIRIWDVASGTELIALRGHRRRIQNLAFSPDGATLASSSDDGTVKLWQTSPSHAGP
jgi:WD40 repeat protein